MMSTGTKYEILEIGVVSSKPQKCDGLSVGEVGYLITGVKDVRQSKVGDTVTSAKNGAVDALPGYADPNPMRYWGLFPMSQEDYPDLRDALVNIDGGNTNFQELGDWTCSMPTAARSAELGLAAVCELPDGSAVGVAP